MQAKDRRFLRELAPDKDYLEKMVSTLSGSKEFLVHGRKRDVAIHVSLNVGSESSFHSFNRLGFLPISGPAWPRFPRRKAGFLVEAEAGLSNNSSP